MAITPEAALIVMLGMVFILATIINYPTYLPPDDGVERKKEPESENYKPSENSDVHRVVVAVESVRKELQRQNHHSRASEDFERRIKIAEVGGLWLAAIVGVAAIYVGSSDAGSQLGVMSKQQGIMQNQLDEMQIEERPIIVVDIPKVSSVKFHDGDIDVAFELVVKNSGKSPALHVTENFEIKQVTQIDFANVLSDQSRFCNQLRHSNQNGFFLGAENNQSSGVQHTIHGIKNFGSNGAVILIVGCFDYVFAYAPDKYGQTGFSYMITKIPGPNNDGGFHPGDVVGPDGLRAFSTGGVTGSYFK